MARVTRVAKAQARYKTVPVFDPTTGEQKITPVMRSDGTQKVTKKGKPVVLRVTKSDKSQPLPNQTCNKCGKEIKVGDPYKWIQPKSGPYGGHRLVRCDICPTWQIWDYSSSLSARTAQISHEAWDSFPDDADNVDAITDWLSEVADSVQELADEKAESAQNIEDGFGHETSTSQELTDIAEQLESWAEEIRGADVPEVPDAEPVECEECGGTGKVDNPDYDEDDEETDDKEIDCEECDGSGEIDADEPSDEEMDTWRDEVKEAASVIDECPV